MIKRGKEKTKYLFFSFYKFYLCRKSKLMKNHCLLLFFVVLLLVSCKNRPIKIVAEIVPVKTVSDTDASLSMMQLIAPYKVVLDEKMNVPVGVCVTTMDVGRPESLLSNFVCDAMLKKANEFMPTDFALTNVGGLRKSISQGEVTLRTVYEVMPFDNRLVLLDLSGHDVSALCDAIALVGGEGVSGITFGIENGKAVGAKIAGKAIDANRIYRLATNDYLSFGNDKMEPLVNSLSVYDTGLQLRDLILESIAELSPIESVLDGRIYEK